MAKLKKVGRPTGRKPVIAVRVEPPLHKEIAADAKAAQRTMAAEIEGLLRQALTHRKRFPNSAAALVVEMATLGFIITGEHYARDNEIAGPWHADLASRREATLTLCATMITQFVSTDPREQAKTVDALRGRIWTHIVSGETGDDRDVERCELPAL